MLRTIAVHIAATPRLMGYIVVFRSSFMETLLGSTVGLSVVCIFRAQKAGQVFEGMQERQGSPWQGLHSPNPKPGAIYAMEQRRSKTVGRCCSSGAYLLHRNALNLKT